MKKTLLVLFTAVFFMMFPTCPAAAAKSEDSVLLPLSQSMMREVTEPAKVHYTLTPKEKDFPMPDGSENGVYELTVVNNAKVVLPAMHFDEVGIYAYVLQAEGDRCDVSPASVDVTIYVFLSEGERKAQVIAQLPDGEKCTLDFAVSPSPTPTPSDTSQEASDASEESQSVEESSDTRPPESSYADPSTRPSTGDASGGRLYVVLLVVSALLIVCLKAAKSESSKTITKL